MLNLNKNHIYKYVPFSINTLKLLAKNEIWMGSPKDFNDPLDSKFKFNVSGSLPNDEFLKKFYKEELFIDNAIVERIERNKTNINFLIKDIESSLIEELNSKIGISCFSKKNDDNKMWAYYADSHKGMCLIFDKLELGRDLDCHSSIIYSEVCYEKELPTINIMLEENNITFNNLDYKSICKIKLEEWISEDEIRYIMYNTIKDCRRNIPFNISTLKGRIFGQNIDIDNASTIYHILIDKVSDDFIWAKSIKNFNTDKIEISYTKPELHNFYKYLTY